MDGLAQPSCAQCLRGFMYWRACLHLLLITERDTWGTMMGVRAAPLSEQAWGPTPDSTQSTLSHSVWVGGHGASGLRPRLRHARTCTEAPRKHPEVPSGTHVWRHTVAVRAEAALGPHCGVDGGEGGSGNEGKSLCTTHQALC